ncbi:MAG: VWA domain-containing protein [Planctomycetota bacterium]
MATVFPQGQNWLHRRHGQRSRSRTTPSFYRRLSANCCELSTSTARVTAAEFSPQRWVERPGLTVGAKATWKLLITGFLLLAGFCLLTPLSTTKLRAAEQLALTEQTGQESQKQQEQQEPMPSPAEEKRSFSGATRTRLTNDLRQRAVDARLAALREMASYATDLNAVRLIVQHGLRASEPQVQAAAVVTLRGIPGAWGRDSTAVERWLIDELRRELADRTRRATDRCALLVTVLVDRRTPSATRSLIQLILDRDSAAREPLLRPFLESLDRAAVERGDEVRGKQFVEVLEGVAASPLFATSAGVRKCVCDAAGQVRQANALGFMIHQLEQLDGQLRQEVVEQLEQTTGQRWGNDSVAWRRWWREHGARFEFPPEEASREQRKPPRAAAYYYDLPLHARRLVFILDTSKSMGAGGTTSRLELAKRELVRAIEQLPEDAQFNVIVFQSTVESWSARLELATAATKIHARAFVNGQRPAGQTATYDALQAALRLGPDLESIYLLSDGAPSEGTVVAPARILDLIRQQNATQRTRIYTLGAFPGEAAEGRQGGAEAGGKGKESPVGEEFLRSLATQNYGLYVRLK